MAIDLVNNPAIPVVLEGWDYIKSEASGLVDEAKYAISDVSASLYGFTTPVISFTAPAVNAGTFYRPAAPEAPVIAAIDTTTPVAPSLAGVTLDDLPAAPTEPDFSGMVYVKPGVPTYALPTEPADTDVPLVEIDIPDALTFEMPDDPALYELNLPAIPDLSIPAFDGVRPTFNLEPPAHTFSWQYQTFDESGLSTIKAQLSAMTINGLALPPDVEQAIFDRLRGREDALSLQAFQQAAEEIADLGWRRPVGLVQKRRDRIVAQNRQAASTASRDLSIEIARQNVEAVKFGISQGIALESTLLQAHISIQTLTLDAAKATQAAFIQVFEAQVSLHNAQWEGFKAEAQVYESRIRALSAEVDAYRAQVEAQKAIGDVNESLVRAYGEKIRALSAYADIYRAQVEGAKAKGEINVQRLEQARLRIQTFGIKVDAWGKGWEGYRAQVEGAKAKGEINVQRLEQARLRIQTFGIKVDAWGKGWDGYRAQVEAETAGLRYWETQGNIYANRVQAWRGQVEAQDTRARTELASQAQLLDVYRAELAGFAARIQGDTATGELAARIFQARAGMYDAEGRMSSAEVGAINDSERTKLDGSRLVYDAAKSNAEIAANVGLKRIEYGIDANRGVAQIWAQLGASVYSGMNLSGSVSYSSNNSITAAVTP